MSAKQTLKQRKALRSAAAKKGWETRQQNRLKAFACDLHSQVIAHVPQDEQRHAKFIADHQQAYKAGYDFAESMRRVNSECAPKHSLWQRIKGWFA